MKNTEFFRYMKRKPSHATTESILFAVSKDEWDIKRALVIPRRMYCMYCGMPKGTSRAEAMLNRYLSFHNDPRGE